MLGREVTPTIDQTASNTHEAGPDTRMTLQPEVGRDQPTPRIASMTFGLDLATGTLRNVASEPLKGLRTGSGTGSTDVSDLNIPK